MPQSLDARRKPTWSAVKACVGGLDRQALVRLIGDLYAAADENRSFLHARFGIGVDPLDPYRRQIIRNVWPDIIRGEDISVAEAKAAISQYRRAIGDPVGLLDLMTIFCEHAGGFIEDVGAEDESLHNALCDMFEGALDGLAEVDEPHRQAFQGRLEAIQRRFRELGFGTGDAVDRLWNERLKRNARGGQRKTAARTRRNGR